MRDYESHRVTNLNRSLDSQFRLAFRQFKFRHITKRFYFASLLFTAVPTLLFTYLVDNPQSEEYDIFTANVVSIATGTVVSCPLIRKPLRNLYNTIYIIVYLVQILKHFVILCIHLEIEHFVMDYYQ